MLSYYIANNFFIFTILSFFLSVLVIKYFLIDFKNFTFKKNQNRWGDSNKSHFGGVVFTICSISCLIYLFVGSNFYFLISNPNLNYILGLLIVIFFTSAVGILDERRNLKPLTKLLLQIVTSLIIISFDYIIPVTNNLLIDSLITIFWLTFLINAINMFDNVDLAAGLFCLINFILLIIISLKQPSNYEFTIICSVYIGSIIAFLSYNYYPSKIFMGDIGSFQLASVLGALSIKLIWIDQVVDYEIISYKFIYNILANNLMFILVFLDVLFVFTLRINSGVSPFSGDTNHFSHSLIKQLNSPNKSALVIAIITIICCSIYLYMSNQLSDNYVNKFAIISLFYISITTIILKIYLNGINLKNR